MEVAARDPGDLDENTIIVRLRKVRNIPISVETILLSTLFTFSLGWWCKLRWRMTQWDYSSFSFLDLSFLSRLFYVPYIFTGFSFYLSSHLHYNPTKCLLFTVQVGFSTCRQHAGWNTCNNNNKG
jgi:hypothetical protein